MEGAFLCGGKGRLHLLALYPCGGQAGAWGAVETHLPLVVVVGEWVLILLAGADRLSPLMC